MVAAGWTGRIIDGRYAVESVIGAGGMGLVLKARHTFTGATVALKVIKPELELDVHFQQRFLVEARAPNAIGHPAIVNVLDAGKAPDGVLYLAMELLVGRSLRIPAARGELSASEIRRLLLELLDVLAAAHARGFVHRDLKPENVFLVGPSNQLKLLDFGIAKVLDASLVRARTATGATLGTPAYMAPEQFADPRGVDARADLWAVGVIAYELLAQALPFRGETTHSMLLAIASAEPDPIRAYLPQAPPPLEAFFARALSRNVAGRFGSAAEMAQAIAALPFGTAIIPRPVPQMQQRAGFAHGETPVATPAAMPFAATPAATPFAAIPASAPSPAHVAPSLPDRVPAPATAPHGPDRRSWIVGLGLATLISLAVIIIALLATRHDAPAVKVVEVPPAVPAAEPAPDADAAVTPTPIDVPPAVPASGQDVVKTVKHAGRPTVDAGVPAAPPVDAGPKHVPIENHVTTPSPDSHEDNDEPRTISEIGIACRARCDAVASSCGNAPNCMDDCRRLPAFRDCIKLPLGNCGPISACGMRAVCGTSVLRGRGSCLAAFACQVQRQCSPTDIVCGCLCANDMAEENAYALSVVDACAFTCHGGEQCFNEKCLKVLERCH